MSTLSFEVSARLARRQITNGAVGFIVLALAYLAFFISDTMLALDDDRSQIIKVCAFGLLSLALAMRPRFHRLIQLAAPLLLLLLVGLMRSFNKDAGWEEFLRFLFPVVITMTLFAYRDKLDGLVTVFFAVVISNDLFQCYFYLAYLTGMPLLLPIRIDSGLFLRAQGWIGFFSEFSFINFCAFMLCRWYRPTKSAKFMSWIYMLFAVLGFSFKLFVPLMFYPLIVKKGTLRVWVVLVAGICAALFLLANGYLDSLLGVASAKLSFYVIAGNSARAESYRVMFESLGKINLIGEGLGSFGGPASVKYGSPLYSQYHFNWYGLGNILKTTDTFYPHLFVELGLIGAAIWMQFVLFYGQGRKWSAPWLFIVGAFCFDNLFSMAILSPSYVFSALLIMYVFSRNYMQPANRLSAS